MKKQYQILNGDSLKQQFPKNIEGEIIVARECLLDGNVKGSSLEELFHSRAQFISNNYKGYSEQDYYKKTVPEFEKIQNITDNADINLWFEDDLFCQVNFWFVVHLILTKANDNQIFLVRPKTHNLYGFASLKKPELISIYENRLLLTELDKIANLWELYQSDDLEQLLKTARQLEHKYPFILTAVKAHIDRMPTKGNLGRPSQSLIQIMKELKSEEFEAIFKEFNKRESIYGFGDLQVKRLFDEIINNR